MKQIRWVAPSKKQRQILSWWAYPKYQNCAYVELEGSVRSAKTSTGALSFVLHSLDKFDGEELAFCGKTIGACRRNVIRPLKKLLYNQQGFHFQDRRSATEGDYLTIEYNGKSNTYWVFGGNDESSQDLIQGMTWAGAFLDEVLLMPLSFVNQALSRLSVEGATAWFTFNPESPTHPIYSTILDPYKEAGKAFYLHLTMDDNPSLSQETKDRIGSQWPVGSVWHQRNVLGLRVAAEGAIFPFFSTDTANGYVIAELPKDLDRWMVYADYGQEHPTTFGLYAYSHGLGSWILVKEYYSNRKPNTEYSKDFGEFIKWDGQPVLLREVDIDAAGGGASLIAQLRQDYPELADRGLINHAYKHDVSSELQELASALYTHKLRYYVGCKRSISEIANYRWATKPKGSAKEEPLKENDDGPDRDRYAWNRIKRYYSND